MCAHDTVHLPRRYLLHPLQVSRDKKWADLGRLLGYTGIPGLATQMRNSYSRVILPYEQFCERVRSSTTLSPIKPRDPSLKTHASIQSLGTAARTGSPTPRAGPSSTAADDDSPPSSPLTATSSPLSEPPEESELREANGVKAEGDKPRRRSARHASMEQTAASTRTSSFLSLSIFACRGTLSGRAGGRRASTANEANGSANEKKNPRDEVRKVIDLTASVTVGSSAAHSCTARFASSKTRARRC